MQTYREQSYAPIDAFIGRIYPKVVVGYLDNDLEVFDSITHLLAVQSEPGTTRTVYRVPMSIKPTGIYIARNKKEHMKESRAVILGNQGSDEMQRFLLDLKNLYDMDGILYLRVSKDGQVDDAKYFNHANRDVEKESDEKVAIK